MIAGPLNRRVESAHPVNGTITTFETVSPAALKLMAAGTLYVVATPIGNLEDITLRALRVLREAQVIAAEDTRRTARLLAHHAISTPMVSFHEHNTRSRTPALLARLKAGDHVALVTDAGTPGVSDPGSELVNACVSTDIPVVPVPGASAALAAAAASGFPLVPLTVLGFPPTRSNARMLWLAAAAETKHTVTFFEAPHRITRTLNELAPVLVNRPIMVGRELTKVHEELLFGTTADVVERLPDPRGEFTVVIGPAEAVVIEGITATDDEIARMFGLKTETGGATRRQAVAEVAAELRKSSKEVYAAIERSKKDRTS
jgi:16S rRNA (cytidine1402-2'-O)-methyltransferase